MSREHFEEMLDYYQREMIYLRNAGGRFAKRYPQIAEGLDLSDAGTSDPHVERLLESFAFLTARLQKEVDDKFIRFASTLLDVLYPNFTRPFPSCSIAKFRMDPNLGKTAIGFEVPKGTSLFKDAQTGQTLRFQTAYPVKLLPLDVTDAKILPVDETLIPSGTVKSEYVLRLTVTRDDGDLSHVNLDQLRIHLAGDNLTTNFLHDAIFSCDPLGTVPIYIRPDNEDTPSLSANSRVKPVGFGEDEDLVPYPKQVHEGYRLLQEFFLFSDKFKFVDITNLDTSNCSKSINILIPLAEGVKSDRFKVNASNFQLGCTPIVNIFKRITEPIALDQKSLSYPLVADQREADFTEIHSIQKVLAAVSDEPAPIEYSPYFSYNHKISSKGQSLFWSSYRLPSNQADVEGSDVFLNFLDFDFTPQKPADQTIFAHVLCTNRNLAQHLTAGASLHVDDQVPSSKVTCLGRPTQQVNAVMQGEILWRIISQLSLNHLTLTGTDQGLSAFKEMLRLYAEANKSTANEEISGIESIQYETVTRRMSNEAWRGFVQGLSVNLTSTSVRCDGSSTFLMASVLSHFLSIYVNINSFVELSLTSTNMPGIWKQWPARIGNRYLL